MSDQDRLRWNERYNQSAGQQRRQPSRLLVEVCSERSSHQGAALDIACGSGRNALYLASLGYQVLGLDVSDVALAQARTSARAQNLDIDWQVRDLELEPSFDGQFQLICMIRYVNFAVLEQAAGALAPGGILVVEEHLRTQEPVAGPRNPKFRVEPGALRAALGALDIIHETEGLVTDPDGTQMALARLVARCRE